MITMHRSHHDELQVQGARGGAGRASVQNGDWEKVPGCTRCVVWMTDTVLTPFPCSVPLLAEGAAGSLSRRRRQAGEQEVGRATGDLTPHRLFLLGAVVPGSGVWGLAHTEGRTWELLVRVIPRVSVWATKENGQESQPWDILQEDSKVYWIHVTEF